MSWILETLVEWIVGIIGVGFVAICQVFTHALALDGADTLDLFFDLFLSDHMGGANNTWAFMMVIGYLVLFFITLWQLAKVFFGPMARSEHPVMLVGKMLIFMLIISFSKEICTTIFEIGTAPFKVMTELFADATGFDGAVDSLLGGLTEGNMLGGAAIEGAASTIMGSGAFALSASIKVVKWIFIIFILCSIFVNIWKFALEIVERYVLTGVLTLFSPPLIATGVSQATSRIASTWLQMMFSQMVLMCLSSFFLSTAAIGMLNIPGLGSESMHGIADAELAPVIGYMMLLAWLRIATRVDQLMSAMGFGVAQAGDGLFGDMVMGKRMAKDLGGSLMAMGGAASAFGSAAGGMGGLKQAAKSGNLKSHAAGALSTVAGSKQAMGSIQKMRQGGILNGLQGAAGLKDFKNAQAAQRGDPHAKMKADLGAAKNAGKAVKGTNARDGLNKLMGSQGGQLGRKLEEAGFSCSELSLSPDGSFEALMQHDDGSLAQITGQVDEDGNLTGGLSLGPTQGPSANGLKESDVQSGSGIRQTGSGTDINGKQVSDVTGTTSNLKNLNMKDTSGNDASISLPEGCVNADGEVSRAFALDSKGNPTGEMVAAEGGGEYADANGNKFTLNDDMSVATVGDAAIDGEQGMSLENSGEKALMEIDANGSYTAMNAKAGADESASWTAASPDLAATEQVATDTGTQSVIGATLNEDGAPRVAPEQTEINGDSQVDLANVQDGNAGGAAAATARENGLLNADGSATQAGQEAVDLGTNQMLPEANSVASIGGDGTFTAAKGADGGSASAQAFNKARQNGASVAGLVGASGVATAKAKVGSDGVVRGSAAAMSVLSAAGDVKKNAGGQNVLTAQGQQRMGADGTISRTAAAAKGAAATKMGGYADTGIAKDGTGSGQAFAAAASAGANMMSLQDAKGHVSATATVGADGMVRGSAAAMSVLSAAGDVKKNSVGQYVPTEQGRQRTGRDGTISRGASFTGGVSMTPSASGKASSAGLTKTGSGGTLAASSAARRTSGQVSDAFSQSMLANQSSGKGLSEGLSYKGSGSSRQLCATVSTSDGATLAGSAAALGVMVGLGLASKGSDGSCTLTSQGKEAMGGASSFTVSTSASEAGFKAAAGGAGDPGVQGGADNLSHLTSSSGGQGMHYESRAEKNADGSWNISNGAVWEASGYATRQSDGSYALTDEGKSFVGSQSSASLTCAAAVSQEAMQPGASVQFGSTSSAHKARQAGFVDANNHLTEKGAQSLHYNNQGGAFFDQSGGQTVVNPGSVASRYGSDPVAVAPDGRVLGAAPARINELLGSKNSSGESVLKKTSDDILFNDASGVRPTKDKDGSLYLPTSDGGRVSLERRADGKLGVASARSASKEGVISYTQSGFPVTRRNGREESALDMNTLDAVDGHFSVMDKNGQRYTGLMREIASRAEAGAGNPTIQIGAKQYELQAKAQLHAQVGDQKYDVSTRSGRDSLKDWASQQPESARMNYEQVGSSNRYQAFTVRDNEVVPVSRQEYKSMSRQEKSQVFCYKDCQLAHSSGNPRITDISQDLYRNRRQSIAIKSKDYKARPSLRSI